MPNQIYAIFCKLPKKIKVLLAILLIIGLGAASVFSFRLLTKGYILNQNGFFNVSDNDSTYNMKLGSNDVRDVFAYNTETDSDAGAWAANVSNFNAANAYGTTDIAQGRPATASSQVTGFEASKAVDGDSNTYWAAFSASGAPTCGTATTPPCSITVDLSNQPAGTQIGKVFIKGTTGSPDSTLQNFKILTASSAFGPWTTVKVVENVNFPKEDFDLRVMPTAATFFKIEISSFHAGGSGPGIKDLKIYTFLGSTNYGANIAQSSLGAVAEAQSVLDSHFAASVIDSDPASYWSNQNSTTSIVYPTWIKVTLPQSQAIGKAMVVFKGYVQYYGDFSPRSFNIQVSNDGTNWKKVGEVVDNPNFNKQIVDQPFTFTFNPVLAKYIKCEITAAYGNQMQEVIMRDFAVFPINVAPGSFALDSFPKHANLILTNKGLDIVNADNNVNWNRYTIGEGNLIGDLTPTAVTAKNGKIYIGTAAYGSFKGRGLFVFDLINNKAYRAIASNATDTNLKTTANSLVDLSQANNGIGYGDFNAGAYQLVSENNYNNIADLSVNVVGGKTYLAVLYNGSENYKGDVSYVSVSQEGGTFRQEEYFRDNAGRAAYFDKINLASNGTLYTGGRNRLVGVSGGVSLTPTPMFLIADYNATTAIPGKVRVISDSTNSSSTGTYMYNIAATQLLAGTSNIDSVVTDLISLPNGSANNIFIATNYGATKIAESKGSEASGAFDHWTTSGAAPSGIAGTVHTLSQLTEKTIISIASNGTYMWFGQERGGIVEIELANPNTAKYVYTYASDTGVAANRITALSYGNSLTVGTNNGANRLSKYTVRSDQYNKYTTNYTTGTGKLTSNDVKKSFYYDTKKDVDGGAWTNSTGKSWSTVANGEGGPFPTRANIVLTPAEVAIFDADTSALYMRFTSNNANNMYRNEDLTHITPTALYAKNGEIYIGLSYIATSGDYTPTVKGALLVFSFNRDKGYLLQGASNSIYNGTIATRNGTSAYTVQSGGGGLFRMPNVNITGVFAPFNQSNNIIDIDGYTSGNNTYIAISSGNWASGRAGYFGVALYKYSGLVSSGTEEFKYLYSMNTYTTSATNLFKRIKFDPADGTLHLLQQGGGSVAPNYVTDITEDLGYSLSYRFGTNLNHYYANVFDFKVSLADLNNAGNYALDPVTNNKYYNIPGAIVVNDPKDITDVNNNTPYNQGSNPLLKDASISGGKLYLATDQGAYQINAGTLATESSWSGPTTTIQGSATTTPPLYKTLTSSFVWSAASDGTFLYFGTQANGIAELKLATPSAAPAYYNTSSGSTMWVLPNNAVRSINLGKDKNNQSVIKVSTGSGEAQFGTSIILGDSDADGIRDTEDFCPLDPTNTCAPDRAVALATSSGTPAITTPDNNFTLSALPAGAVASGTPVTVVAGRSNFMAGLDGTSGNIIADYEVGPTGTTFAAPVTMTLKYTVNSKGYVNGSTIVLESSPTFTAYQFNTSTNKWQAISGVVKDTTNHKLTFQTSHFSEYALADILYQASILAMDYHEPVDGVIDVPMSPSPIIEGMAPSGYEVTSQIPGAGAAAPIIEKVPGENDLTINVTPGEYNPGNPGNTPFADNFSDGNLAPDWIISSSNGGTTTESGGVLHLIAQSGQNAAVHSIASLSFDSVSSFSLQLEAKLLSSALTGPLHIDVSSIGGGHIGFQWTTCDWSTTGYCVYVGDNSVEYPAMVTGQNYVIKVTHNSATNLASIYINDMNNPVFTNGPLNSGSGAVTVDLGASGISVDIDNLSSDLMTGSVPPSYGNPTLDVSRMGLQANGTTYMEADPFGGQGVLLWLLGDQAGDNTSYPVTLPATAVVRSDANHPINDLYVYLTKIVVPPGLFGNPDPMTVHWTIYSPNSPQMFANIVLALNSMGLATNVDAYAKVGTFSFAYGNNKVKLASLEPKTHLSTAGFALIAPPYNSEGAVNSDGTVVPVGGGGEGATAYTVDKIGTEDPAMNYVPETPGGGTFSDNFTTPWTNNWNASDPAKVSITGGGTPAPVDFSDNFPYSGTEWMNKWAAYIPGPGAISCNQGVCSLEGDFWNKQEFTGIENGILNIEFDSKGPEMSSGGGIRFGISKHVYKGTEDRGPSDTDALKVKYWNGSWSLYQADDSSIIYEIATTAAPFDAATTHHYTLNYNSETLETSFSIDGGTILSGIADSVVPINAATNTIFAFESFGSPTTTWDVSNLTTTLQYTPPAGQPQLDIGSNTNVWTNKALSGDSFTINFGIAKRGKATFFFGFADAANPTSRDNSVGIYYNDYTGFQLKQNGNVLATQPYQFPGPHVFREARLTYDSTINELDFELNGTIFAVDIDPVDYDKVIFFDNLTDPSDEATLSIQEVATDGLEIASTSAHYSMNAVAMKTIDSNGSETPYDNPSNLSSTGVAWWKVGGQSIALPGDVSEAEANADIYVYLTGIIVPANAFGPGNPPSNTEYDETIYSSSTPEEFAQLIATLTGMGLESWVDAYAKVFTYSSAMAPSNSASTHISAIGFTLVPLPIASTGGINKEGQILPISTGGGKLSVGSAIAGPDGIWTMVFGFGANGMPLPGFETSVSGAAKGIYEIGAGKDALEITVSALGANSLPTMIPMSGSPSAMDVVPPSTIAIVAGVQEASFDNWYQDTAAVTLTASDNSSGVQSTKYMLSGATTQSWADYSGPIILTNSGETVVSYKSTDNAGNIENTQSITIGIDKDTDADGVYNNLDACPTISGKAEFQGCPYAIDVLGTLHVVYTGNVSGYAGIDDKGRQKKSISIPLSPGAIGDSRGEQVDYVTTKVYDLAAIQAQIGATNFGKALTSNCASIYDNTTPLNTGSLSGGEDLLGIASRGQYVVAMRTQVNDPGEGVGRVATVCRKVVTQDWHYDFDRKEGRGRDEHVFCHEHPGSGSGIIAKIDNTITKTVKKGDVTIGGKKVTVELVQLDADDIQTITGSELTITSPAEARWEEGVSNYIYPYVFTSDSDWTLDVCTSAPTGYQITGVYDENGNLIASTDCVQALIAGQEKIVAFEVTEVGSPPVFDVNTSITAKHKGKSEKRTLTTSSKHAKASELKKSLTQKQKKGTNNGTNNVIQQESSNKTEKPGIIERAKNFVQSLF